MKTPPPSFARRTAHISATMFARAAAGDVSCPYRVWADSHIRGGRLISDFNRTLWQTEHTSLVRSYKAQLLDEGYVIFEEEQNKFRLTGASGAVLSGKADLIAVKDNAALVIDCKTGKYRRFHGLQVLLYMYVLRYHQQDHPACGCRSVHGRVQYQHATVDIPAAATEVIPKLLKQHIATILSETAPAPTPSYGECRFCDLGPELCSERIEAEPAPSTTDLF